MNKIIELNSQETNMISGGINKAVVVITVAVISAYAVYKHAVKEIDIRKNLVKTYGEDGASDILFCRDLEKQSRYGTSDEEDKEILLLCKLNYLNTLINTAAA